MASTSDTDLFNILLYGGSTRSGTLSTGDVGTLIDASANVYIAASRGALAESGSQGGIESVKVGDLAKSYADSQGGYLALSKQLRVQGVRSVTPYAGGISRSDKQAQVADTDWDRPAAHIGMHDNPPVGDSTGTRRFN